jgi:chromosome segregation ATPase
MEMRLKGTMNTIQYLEAELAEKNKYIKDIEEDLQASKRKIEKDSAENAVKLHMAEQVAKPQIADVSKSKKIKEIEKRLKEAEDTISEMKRRNNRLEMLNDQLAEKLKKKTEQDEERNSTMEKLNNKLAKVKGKYKKVKGMAQSYYIYIIFLE